MSEKKYSVTRSVNVMLMTTEQHLFVCSGKSETEVIIEECARAIVLLKVTTDRHEASTGLSAIAELLVLYSI